MRLVQRNEDGGFSLAEYLGSDIPRYAILSHTWGEDRDEVTFKDLSEAKGTSKAGYRKLTFCANQAAQDGLRFFWVDTCCIEKTSSAELSEAINSMFKWYRGADKCYVYLSDVSVGASAPGDLSSQQMWKLAFRDSRWFTRGWTLQELLAPEIVEFFSADGVLLGDKISLLQEICSITGISAHALQGASLGQLSVDERMSWAKKRGTKREEDAAYSLLGIFDIHMPLLYGEGREKALARLRKEIRSSAQTDEENREYVQQSHLLKALPSSTVPFRRDDDFISRDSLDKIHQMCSRPASCAALVGLGGVGKSQIAIEYAYQVRDKSPDTWVFWVHAGTRARFEEGYRRIAEATKMNAWNDPKADVLRLVRRWLCDESNGRWVMVIDNADDMEVFFPPLDRHKAVGATASDHAVEALSDFLPQSPDGSILVTSRNRDVAHRLTGSNKHIVEVKPMVTSEALALLRNKLDFDMEDNGAVELIHLLDRMPLAITQAAAYIAQRAPRMSVLQYVEEIRRSDRGGARLLETDVGDSRRDSRESNSIIATWRISFEHIRKVVPTAARLLSLMSMFDRQGIPEKLLQGQYQDSEHGEANFDNDIHTLTNYSLVEISADGREFKMHRLVQFSTKKWLELFEELEEWKETFIMLINESYPVGRHENWKACQVLFPHVRAMIEYRPAHVEALQGWASVLFKAAWYASEMGQYEVAKEMGSGALEAREATLGVEHPDTLNSINGIALVLMWQGDYKAAIAMNRRALEGSEKVLGKEHPDTLISISNLASMLQYQGDYKAAEAMNQRALEGREKVLGKEHPSTLTSMNNLALVLQYQGDYKAAEAMNRRALERYEKVLGKEHPNTLTSISNLAMVLQYQGDYKAAEAMNQRALEGREKVLGKEHPSTLTSMNNLASVLQYQGDYKAAEAMNRRALEGYEKVLGKEHPDTLSSMSNLAMVLRYQGDYKAAETVNRRALEGYKKVLGKEHPGTLTSIYNLAYLLGDLRRYDEALPLYQRASSGYINALGPDHPTTRACLANQSALQRQLDGEARDDARPKAIEDSVHPTPATSLDANLPKRGSTSKHGWWQKFKKESSKRARR